MTILARLTPKTSNYTQGCGGIPTLTQSDVAGALGMMHSATGVDIMRFKDLGDVAAGGRLSERWRVTVERIAEKEGWTVRDENRLRYLADGVLHEYLMELHVCTECNGLGLRQLRGGVTRVCTRCEGAGVVKVPVAVRARLLKCDEKTFRTSWVPKWEQLLAEIAQIEFGAREELGRRLR